MQSRGNLFDPTLVEELIKKVRGKSSIVELIPNSPTSFNGNEEVVFTFDNEIDLVAEGGKFSEGGITLTPQKRVPVKVEYGARVTREFVTAAEETQINYLQEFLDGFSNKLGKGLDLIAFHGINPRTNTVSALVSPYSFDTKVTQTVTYGSAAADEKLEDAITLVEDNEFQVNGIIISPTMRKDIANLTDSNGNRMYPEFKFGGAPSTLGAGKLSVNPTVSKAYKANADAQATAVDQAIVGDFTFMKWGYGKDIEFEVIEYGNPDNSALGDLKGSDQVYLRAKCYISAAIFAPEAFARITVA